MTTAERLADMIATNEVKFSKLSSDINEILREKYKLDFVVHTRDRYDSLKKDFEEFKKKRDINYEIERRGINPDRFMLYHSKMMEQINDWTRFALLNDMAINLLVGKNSKLFEYEQIKK